MAKKPSKSRLKAKASKEQMESLARAMDQFADEVKAKVDTAIKESAYDVQDTAKSKVKVVTGEYSEKLKDAIIVKHFDTRKDTIMVWDVGIDPNHEGVLFSKEATQYRVYHGYNRKEKDPRWEKKRYYLPAIIEYGTARAKANPYLRPALKTHRTTAKRRIVQAIREVTSRDYSD